MINTRSKSFIVKLIVLFCALLEVNTLYEPIGTRTFIERILLVILISFGFQDIETIKWLLPLDIGLYLTFFALSFAMNGTGRKYQNYVGTISILVGIIGVVGLVLTVKGIYGENNLQMGVIGLWFLVYATLYMIYMLSDDADWQ